MQKGLARNSNVSNIFLSRFSRIRACISVGKLGIFMVHSARTPFIVPQIMRRLTGIGSQPCFQAGSINDF